MSTFTISRPKPKRNARLHSKRLSAEPNYVTLLPPGEILAEKLDEMGLTVEMLSEHTGLPLETIRKIIQANIPVTPEIAELLQRETQIPVYNWLRHEECYQQILSEVNDRQHTDKTIYFSNHYSNLVL